MSMNLVEKGFAIGAIGLSVLFIGRSVFGGPKVEKHNAFKVRQQLLKRQDTKMLYSTMSFFYLVGFQQQSLDSFYTLRKIMDIEKPNIIAIPISKQDYQNKYLKAMSHPKFRQAMDKFAYYLKNEDSQSIKKMQQFDLKNLEKLYLIDQCVKLKKCKVVPVRRTSEQYSNVGKVHQQLRQSQSIDKLTLTEIKVQDYAQNIVKQMNPKVKFSILPESPYKTIVGIVEPELLSQTAEKWKVKFQKKFNHQIIEDQEVLEREKVMRQAQNKQV